MGSHRRCGKQLASADHALAHAGLEPFRSKCLRASSCQSASAHRSRNLFVPFLYKTTNSIWPSAFAAAFFALHPLRVESVAWASERKDVLSMFFGMAALYAYAFYAEKNKIHHYLFCLILFALSLMSKPMLVTLPFVLILLDYWPLNRWMKALAKTDDNSTGKLILEKIPFLCLTIASCIITFWAHNTEGSVASADSVPFFTRFANAAVSYTAYLEKSSCRSI